MKQRTIPIALHLQEEVGRELEKLIKTGHLENQQTSSGRKHRFQEHRSSERKKPRMEEMLYGVVPNRSNRSQRQSSLDLFLELNQIM